MCKKKLIIIFINHKIEAQPTEEEKAIHSTVAAVLDKGPVVLDKLFKYEGN